MAGLGNCKYCDKKAIVKIGRDESPVCEEHFNKFIRGVALVVEKAKRVLSDNAGK